MSSNASTSASRIQIKTESREDLRSLGSNIGNISSRREDSSMDAYRWYGTKYLEDSLAKQIAMTARKQSQAGLNAMLSKRLSEFDYVAAYRTIGHHIDTGVSPVLREQCNDDKQTYMTAIGLVQLSGTPAAKALLSTSLHDIMSAPKTLDPSANGQSGERSFAEPSAGQYREATAYDTADDELLPMYSMALHEHCQQRGKTVSYAQGTHLRLDPPLWETTLHYGGKAWTARGRQIKQAKQRAAKMACDAIGVRVNNGIPVY